MIYHNLDNNCNNYLASLSEFPKLGPFFFDMNTLYPKTLDSYFMI